MVTGRASCRARLMVTRSNGNGVCARYAPLAEQNRKRNRGVIRNSAKKEFASILKF